MSVVTPSKKVWTILDLITWGTSYLNEKGFEESRLTVELLIAHVLHLQRIQLYTSFDRPLSDNELSDFKELLKRRLTNEPVQYILGETEFMGIRFFVDPRVLIPRPDTEILVETVIAEWKQRFHDANEFHILEIGTGSGCIAISLAKLIPNAVIIATDSSADAITVAEINRKLNTIEGKIKFFCSDFLTEPAVQTKFHCIVANPPYISTVEYQQLDPTVKNFEPPAALTDQSDGLTFYKAIALRGVSLLNENGFAAVEHAYDQSKQVQTIFHDHGWKNISAIKDYGGNFRCVITTRGDE